MLLNSNPVRACVLAAGVAMLLNGCAADVGDEPIIGNNYADLTWDEFLGMIHQDEEGVYIVNGDETIEGDKRLREFYDALVTNDPLIVHRAGGADAKWSDSQKLNLTYCVSSSSFGSRYTTVVNAMNSATAAWESVANINFIHSSSQDSNCTASNGNVVFDVRQTSDQSFLARAFFPNQSRSTRNVLISTSAFGNISPWTLTGILRHELGHALGFRHEHTRPEAGTCFEDNNWRALTNYDKTSVMHYPHCNGNQTGDLVITSTDAAGAAALYNGGGGGGGGGTCPAGYASLSASLTSSADSDTYTYSRYSGGHHFVLIGPSGTDFDLYLRDGGTLRAQSISSSSNEQIDFNGTADRIIVDSYTGSGTYTLCYLFN